MKTESGPMTASMGPFIGGTYPRGSGRRMVSGISACRRQACTPVTSPLGRDFTTTSQFGNLRLRYSPAAMARSLRSRYELGLPSIAISNCTPDAFSTIIIATLPCPNPPPPPSRACGTRTLQRTRHAVLGGVDQLDVEIDCLPGRSVDCSSRLRCAARWSVARQRTARN
jgi:hypothetical protein